VRASAWNVLMDRVSRPDVHWTYWSPTHLMSACIHVVPGSMDRSILQDRRTAESHMHRPRRRFYQSPLLRTLRKCRSWGLDPQENRPLWL